ncbi:hypothetical protein MMC27_002671 [Xylographa pallens]|nr:hypothetical protein [Xylographa pallens]
MPVGFLDLPPEVRDCVYRPLLLSSQCFNAENAVHKYEMCPAIIRAKRVTYYEATRVLYQENDFVRINLRGQAGDKLHGWLKKIADIDFRPWVAACHPALTVHVSLSNMSIKSTQLKSTFLIFPESLEVLVECFYDYAVGGWEEDGTDPIGQLAVSLELRSMLLSKRRVTQEDLLMPFRHLTGFADVKILGCTSEGIRDIMVHRMTHLPSPEQFSDSLEYLLQCGKEAYALGCLNEARHKWKLMLKYYKHIDTIIDSRFSLDESVGLLHEAVMDSRPMIHSAALGVLKAGLHLEDYPTVLRDLWVWEFEEENIGALIEAQFYLGLAMAYHAEGFSRLGREAFKGAQDIIAIEAYQYTGQLVAIMNTISWACQSVDDPGSQFSCAWEQCWALLDMEADLDEKEDAGSMEMDDAQTEFADFGGMGGTGPAEEGGIEVGTMMDDSAEAISEMGTRYDEYEIRVEGNTDVIEGDRHPPEADEQGWVDW